MPGSGRSTGSGALSPNSTHYCQRNSCEESLLNLEPTVSYRTYTDGVSGTRYNGQLGLKARAEDREVGRDQTRMNCVNAQAAKASSLDLCHYPLALPVSLEQQCISSIVGACKRIIKPAGLFEDTPDFNHGVLLTIPVQCGFDELLSEKRLLFALCFTEGEF